RTAVNVTGDAVVSTIVARSEDELDIGVYLEREAGLVEVPEIDKEVGEELSEAVHRVEEKA
ncbi:MAG: dicarboxylate/amino acid:cation symporter, partial [Campylobacterales bacterium]|nr:dicarboxylate/amino acid:cation symporter [Campylobacterales bacterium]